MPSFRPPRRLRPRRSTTAALRALLALVGLLAGVPVVLVRAAGWPLPRRLPTADDLYDGLTAPIDRMTVVKIVACVAWLVWLSFSASVIAEVRATLTGRAAGRMPLATGRLLARRLVSAALVIATSAPAARAAAAPPSNGPIVATAPANPASVGADAATQLRLPEAAPSAQPESRESREVTVRDGNHLWALAEQALTDTLKRPPNDDEVASYWRLVVAANRDRFPNPDLIYSGQHVVLPPVPHAMTPTAKPPRPAAVPPKAAPPRSPDAPARPTGPAAPSPTSSPAPQTPAPTQKLAPIVVVRRTVELPSGTVVAASFLAGLAAAHTFGRLRRRRLYRPSDPVPLGAVDEPPSPLRAALASSPAPADQERANASWLFHGSDDVPERIPFAHQADEPVVVDLLDPGSVAVCGPTAAAAVRAAAMALLTQAGPRGARVVIPAPTFDELFSAVPGAPAPPNVTRTADVASALAELEVERVRRLRLFEHDEVDFRTYRIEHPEDPPPVVLVVTSDLAGHEARHEALVDNGLRLGLAALHIGNTTSPRQATVELDDAGTIVHAYGTKRDSELVAATAYILSTADAAEALAVLAAAVTDEPGPQLDEPATDPLPTPTASVDPSPRVSIRLLGTYQINVDGRPVRTGILRASRELLAYYTIHTDGATADTALETLWPDTPAKSAKDRWDNAIGSLHRGLKAPMGLSELALIERDGEFYRLNTDLVDVDLWHLQQALTEAQRAAGTETEARALREAIDRYTGDLLDGAPYGWAEPLREGLRRRVLDACSRLADQVNSLAERLAVLEKAIVIDAYGEHFYRAAMRIHMANGDREAARRLYRQLEAHLAELDVEPDDETVTILQPGTRRAV